MIWSRWRQLAVAVVVIIVGCQGLPSREADVEGVVRNVTPLSERTGMMLIEWVPLSTDHTRRTVYSRALVTVSERTKVYRESGGERVEIAFRDVVVGEDRRARAWFRGAVTRSDPPQAEADVVVVWTIAP